MRRIIASIVIVGCVTSAAADMTPEEKNFHALHGLMHMYAVGSICYYRNLSFSKQDTDEMRQKIRELSKDVAQKDLDVMWSEARAIMAEGQDKTTADSCAKVREQYVKGRPFIFGTQKADPGKAPL